MNTNKVINCPMEFICNKTWNELIPTDNLNIKFCESCLKTVHFCATQKDLNNALENSLCIAYEAEFKVSSRVLTRRTVGLPRGYKGFNQLFGDNNETN